MNNQQEGSAVQGSSSATGQYTDKDSSFQSGYSNNEASSFNSGTMYQSSGLGSHQLAGTESVSFIASGNNPPSNTVSSFSESGSTHAVGGNGSQLYAGSSNTGEYVSNLEGHGNQATASAVHSNTGDQLSSLSSEEGQASGLVGTAGFNSNSQHNLNSAPSGSSSMTITQSSSGSSERNPETNGALNNEHLGLGTTGHTSNQYSNFNQLGTTSSTSGESGSYVLVNKNQDKNMALSGPLVSQSSGSSVFEGSTYPTTTSNTHLSSSNHQGNQFLSSTSSTGTHLPSSSSTAQHHGSVVYTSGGNTDVVGSNTNGHSSMFDNQGHSSVGLTSGSGINKELTGSVQTTSFRYPGQYTFKYGYVHPNKMYTKLDNPLPNSYEPANIVYSGDSRPNAGSNGFYYHYSTARNPIQISSIETYPGQTNVQDYLNQPAFPVSSEQSSHFPLSSNVDEEDDSYEETQPNNNIKGNLQGYFEHSGGGNFEGSISRPLQGGLSFTGNHELNSGISGGVSGHLGSVGNFQGFLGNAANKVGGIISGVGHAVGIIRDSEDSQTQVDTQENNIGIQQEVPGSLKTVSHQPTILAPILRPQGEHLFPLYLQETHGSKFDKTFSDSKNLGTGQQTMTLNFPLNIVPIRELKSITQEEVNVDSGVESLTTYGTTS